MDDFIVAEVRRIRDEHARKFNYDLDAIFQDLQAREAQSEDIFVSFPAKRIKPVIKDFASLTKHST
jgi:prephenate dehydrogenase